MAERWGCAASKTGRKLLPLLAGAEAVGCQLLWKEVSRVWMDPAQKDPYPFSILPAKERNDVVGGRQVTKR